MSAEKRPTVIDALSRASGLAKPTIREIAERVQANQQRLTDCAGPHDFEDVTPDKPIGKEYRCRKCQGEIRGTEYRWYLAGLVHGRRCAEDGAAAPRG